MTRTAVAPSPAARMGAWTSALVEVAAAWSKAAKDAERWGAEAPWLDWAVEGPLVAELRAAAILADAAAVKVAAGKWRQAWLELLAVHHNALGVRERALELVDESEGRRPPPNSSVHRAVDVARERQARRCFPVAPIPPESNPPASERRPDTGGKHHGASVGDPRVETAQFFSGNYISTKDLGNRSFNLVIARVVQEMVGGEDEAKERKLVVFFHGAQKGLILNKTNWQTLVDLSGSTNSDAWVGCPVQLWNDVGVTFGTNRTGGVRIRAVPQAAPAVHAPAAVAPPAPVQYAQPPQEQPVTQSALHGEVTPF